MNVFKYCSRDFSIKLPQKRIKIDSVVVIPIVGKSIHIFHSNYK